ncbi:UNVERIFIED_CONTAM: Cold-regulated protein 27 [Sesamum radiatum]|uniref:Cold-regulated protein 27 n=1 Tax=Sesamum radiatum TaxID=300843 RepID=A0AAW2PZC8_SESRA
MEDSMDSSGAAARTSVDQEESSTFMSPVACDGKATESEPIEWTDEKHCLFLKSMESTFVNQLYNSIDLFGWHSHKNCPSVSKPSKHKLTSIRASSGQATESEPIEWTDEKHCLFLKSMESTFVNQLYRSIDLFGWHSHNNCPSGSKSSKHKLTSIRASSGQFKVLRDGCWSKIDFRRDEPKVDQEEESKLPLANPWIHRYGTSQTQGLRKSPASHANIPSATTDIQHAANNFRLWQQDSIGGNTGIITPIPVVPSGNIVQVDDVVEAHVNVPPEN